MTVIRAVGTVLTLSMHREAPSATSHEARDVLDGSRAPVTRASRERGHMTAKREASGLGCVTEPFNSPGRAFRSSSRLNARAGGRPAQIQLGATAWEAKAVRTSSQGPSRERALVRGSLSILP